MVRRIARGSMSRLVRLWVVVGVLFALLGAGVVSAVHHHASNESDAGCAICAFAGTHATTAPRAPAPAPLQPRFDRATPLSATRPAAVELRRTSARAPPRA